MHGLPPSVLAGWAPLLEALEGVAYVTDFQGNFLACGTRRWTRFGTDNGAPGLIAWQGLNSLSSCSDMETADAYRLIYAALERGKLDTYSFGFRCDTPRLKRELRMSLTALTLEGARMGVIHHCIALSESERPLVAILQNPLARTVQDRPLIRMCSYCLRICDTPAWIEAEEYYQRGGRSEVDISHGICPDCYQRIVQPVVELS